MDNIIAEWYEAKSLNTQVLLRMKIIWRGGAENLFDPFGSYVI